MASGGESSCSSDCCMESPVSSGIEMIEGDSPESIVSSQELDTPPWWAALLKQHTRHLQFDDSAALPMSLLSTCSGLCAEAFVLKARRVS